MIIPVGLRKAPAVTAASESAERRCLESLPAFLAWSSQSPSEPAGGAPDGYWLGRGATGPRGTTPAARARAQLYAFTHRLLGLGRCYIDRTGPGDVESTGRDYSESLVRT